MAKQCTVVLSGFVCLLNIYAYASEIQFPLHQANQDAISQVQQGTLTWASPAWWGFNADDATVCLQSAIDSGAKEIIVPNMGVPWIVKPIKLHSNQKITFLPGVVILDKKGEFKGRGDSLFSADDVENLVISGYGAILRMHKKDYQNKKEYEPAEWRMVLSMTGCKNVIVEGIRCESSGGDGIYIGVTHKQNYCENAVIKDVICDDNHRQGISVISAKNLTIENCSLLNTSGTAPQAGIDFEPNGADEQLTDITMKNCYISGNKGAGVLVYLKNFKKTTAPVSINIENCIMKGDYDHGIAIGAVSEDGPQGKLIFKNCFIEGAKRGGIVVFDKSSEGLDVIFDSCVCLNTPDKQKGYPIKINQWRKSITSDIGNVLFRNCVILDEYMRKPIEFDTVDKNCDI
ncbi:MAG: right-handed parallel beta-helix repeat-containing protein [Candidatus Hydrogenedens sp.]